MLGLTPALVAGVIADESRRKTLHYLLASRLSGAEIVLGKLLARMLHVGVFLAIGLPVIAGLTLFGGIDPNDVLRIDLGTACTAFALAGLSILVSTVTKRARDAILVTYLIEAVWLFAPWALASWLRSDFPAVARWLVPAFDGLYMAGPIASSTGWGAPSATPPRWPGCAAPNWPSAPPPWPWPSCDCGRASAPRGRGGDSSEGRESRRHAGDSSGAPPAATTRCSGRNAACRGWGASRDSSRA